MERDEWEAEVLKQMVEMFRQLGMDVDEDDLSRMMNQIQSQFEDLGIDPEKTYFPRLPRPTKIADGQVIEGLFA